GKRYRRPPRTTPQTHTKFTDRLARLQDPQMCNGTRKPGLYAEARTSVVHYGLVGVQNSLPHALWGHPNHATPFPIAIKGKIVCFKLAITPWATGKGRYQGIGATNNPVRLSEKNSCRRNLFQP